MDANPDLETLKLTLWVAAGLIMVLLAVVAYFLRKQISISETLTAAVNNLTTAVTVLESQNKDRHPVITKRLDDHARRLDCHDKQIAVIETKISKL